MHTYLLIETMSAGIRTRKLVARRLSYSVRASEQGGAFAPGRGYCGGEQLTAVDGQFHHPPRANH
jgi:hypothetical protein